VKNIAVLTVLVIILSVYSYAEENERNYQFTFGSQFGFVWGQAYEYVYPVPGDTKGKLLSELDWDMKPVFYYGVQAQFSRADLMKAPGFFSSFSFKAGIPADSGNMKDRDWQSIENGNLTNFSLHTNKTNVFIQLDAAAGASFPVNSFLYLKPFLGFSWMRFSFSGRNGYSIYAREKITNSGIYYPIDDNPDEQNFSGKVISYQQDWLILAAGLTAGTNKFNPFFFELSFQISPLTYCIDKDHHYLTNTVYRDFTGLGLFVEPSFKASFCEKKLELSFELSYRNIGKTKGDLYINENNTGYSLADNKAGAGLSMIDYCFLVNIRL